MNVPTISRRLAAISDATQTAAITMKAGHGQIKSLHRARAGTAILIKNRYLFN
jgi:hypothetical protein